MPEAKSCDAVAFLDLLLEFFEDGRRWRRGRFEDDYGNRCLIGAIRYVTAAYNVKTMDVLNARVALQQALFPNLRFAFDTSDLIAFNDSRTNFADIRNLILDARALVLEKIASHAHPSTSPGLQLWAEDMLRNYRAAKAAEAATAIPKTNWIKAEIERKRMIWAARDVARAAKLAKAKKQAKLTLLAEIEHEPAARAAAGNKRPTWISSPHVPEPERLAA
jgi:hypothetical protein